MTVGVGISVSDGRLSVLGETILSDVHENIIVTPTTGGILTNGAFIGVVSNQIGSCRVFSVGKVMTVEGHLHTFSRGERKKMSDILNLFGWCTWDAFYTNVTAQGVKQGLERYVYVWHALDGMEHYESKMVYPVSSPGVQSNEPCDA